MIACLAVWTVSLITLAPPESASPACANDERSFAKRFSMAALAMEPESVVGGIYDRATEAEQRCPGSEPIAYFRLRAAELGRGGAMVGQADADRHALETLASQAFARFPQSVRIATVRARVLGTVDSAKQALAVDPNYLPAKIALAAAMVEAGQSKDAAILLERTPDLGATSDGFAVLARARLRDGDLNGARKAAQMALTGRDVEQLEPDARDPRAESSAHETLGLIFLEKKQYSDAAKHLLIAAETSAQAQKVLANANPSFRRAIEKARRGKKQ